MKDHLEDCRTALLSQRSKFFYYPSIQDRITKTAWLLQDGVNPLHGFYKDYSHLLKRGTVVWGALVQANRLIMSEGKHDHPANILFSVDKYFEQYPNELHRLAANLYAFKEPEAINNEPDVQRFIDIIRDERSPAYNIQLPLSYTSGREVFFTTTMIIRKHLPQRILSNNWFPILADPNKTAYNMILPSKYWSSELIELFNLQISSEDAKTK